MFFNEKFMLSMKGSIFLLLVILSLYFSKIKCFESNQICYVDDELNNNISYYNEFHSGYYI